MGKRLKSTIHVDDYDAQIRLLQIELVKLQRQIISSQSRLLIILEGRDTAGKDGTIKNIVAHLSPRETRVVALSKPTEREDGEWYFQRYVAELPTSGEIVIFNRSWYNRAGVEKVMGFCTDLQYQQFMDTVNEFESLIVGSGIQLIKYYLDIDKKEQVGVIAQDIEKVLPQIVVPAPFDADTDKDGNKYSKSGENYKTVDYPKLIPLLIEAIKEQQEIIVDLQNRLEILEGN